MKVSSGLCMLLCVVSSAPALPAEAPPKTFELAITQGAAPANPRVLRVRKDDVVRLRVVSEVAGEVHVHGYRLELKLAPGTPRELTFHARATGRYPIEWHAAGEAQKDSGHHAPPLAVLEVHPR
ncbi:MAG TPA: hypothetical protein VH881_11550 [Burkholderiales bacterium]|jgi:hypothetical protein